MMDARKVHELFLSQHDQIPGDTTPVNQNIDFKNPANNLNQNPKPVETKNNIDRKKLGRIALGVGVTLLCIYIFSEMPKNKTSPTYFQRRKLRKKESSSKNSD